MTEPIRYALTKPAKTTQMTADAAGAWVAYDDYARLQAENTRLQGIAEEQRQRIAALLDGVPNAQNGSTAVILHQARLEQDRRMLSEQLTEAIGLLLIAAHADASPEKVEAGLCTDWDLQASRFLERLQHSEAWHVLEESRSLAERLEKLEADNRDMMGLLGVMGEAVFREQTAVLGERLLSEYRETRRKAAEFDALMRQPMAPAAPQTASEFALKVARLHQECTQLRTLLKAALMHLKNLNTWPAEPAETDRKLATVFLVTVGKLSRLRLSDADSEDTE